MIIQDDNKIKEYLNDFYDCFETGYDFENFLKIYLMKIGLDEVVVTQRSRDKGIDLIARRPGIGEFSDADSVLYIIQAKRYKPDVKVSSDEIDKLRGVMIDSSKGFFITTSDYSDSARLKANDEIYSSKPIVLVDGMNLIKSCIKNKIGFDFIPQINKDNIIGMTKNCCEIKSKNTKIVSEEDEIKYNIIDKLITENDIRARILRIPYEVKKKINFAENKIKVRINDVESKELTIDKTKTYFAGVTELYRKYKLLLSDGSVNSKAVKMFFDGDVLNLVFDED